MHHRNHKNSSANHGNPPHFKSKPEYPSKPAPSSEKKSVLNRIRERFQEKPATKEEVQQLGLNARREIYKTQIQRAKSSRPSRFSGFGGSERSPSYRRTSSRAPPQTGSWLLGDPSRMGDSFLSGGGSGPSLDIITGNNQRPSRGKKSSGLGQGLTDLF